MKSCKKMTMPEHDYNILKYYSGLISLECNRIQDLINNLTCEATRILQTQTPSDIVRARCLELIAFSFCRATQDFIPERVFHEKKTTFKFNKTEDLNLFNDIVSHIGKFADDIHKIILSDVVISKDPMVKVEKVILDILLDMGIKPNFQFIIEAKDNIPDYITSFSKVWGWNDKELIKSLRTFISEMLYNKHQITLQDGRHVLK